MHPLTADCPKPLLPVGRASLVEHQIARLVVAGAGRIVLSTGYRHEDFAELVRDQRSRGVDLRTVVEEDPLGTGGGLREALRSLTGATAVIVLNGDLLTGHDLGAQVEHLLAAPAEVLGVIHVREVPDARTYGSVLLDEDRRITAFVEKSSRPPSRTVNAGTYVVRPDLLQLIPPSGPVSLEGEVFPRAADAGALLAHPEEAYFLDVGSPAALLTANQDLLRAPWPGALAEPPGSALVLPGADLAADAEVGGGTVVHPGAVVGPGARLEGALVLPGARIGAGAEVLRSVIGRDARVGARARVRDAALGTGATVEPGASLQRATLSGPLPPAGRAGSS